MNIKQCKVNFSYFFYVLQSRAGRGCGYFKVLNLLADTRKKPGFWHFMPLQAAGRDLNKKASKSLKQRAKKKKKQ